MFCVCVLNVQYCFWCCLDLHTQYIPFKDAYRASGCQCSDREKDALRVKIGPIIWRKVVVYLLNKKWRLHDIHMYSYWWHYKNMTFFIYLYFHSEALETQEFTLCVQHFVAHGDSHLDNATWPPAQCHTFCVLIIRNNHLQRPGRSEPVISGK